MNGRILGNLKIKEFRLEHLKKNQTVQIQTFHPKLLVVTLSRDPTAEFCWREKLQQSVKSSLRLEVCLPPAQPASCRYLSLPTSENNCACILQLPATGASAELLG